MKLALCFDDIACIESINSIIDGLCLQSEIETDKLDSQELMHKIECFDFDYELIMLDFNYCNESLDGVLLGRKINEQFPFCSIIYVVDNYDVIPRVYDVKHIALLKKKEIDKWLNHFIVSFIFDYNRNISKNFLNIISRRRKIAIEQTDIEYIVREGRVLEIHADGKNYEIYSSIREMDANLNSLFKRCHGSYIVNIAKVDRYDGQELKMESGVIIPVSKTYKAAFETAYYSYVQKRVF
ncbi:MAG: LytTR family transcriptional regulator [Lachnospiraceae bacterium]|nr:LytTR family transcriptional regulator [Lachnospiraceae bacterium]